MVAVVTWDAVIASIIYLFIIPLLVLILMKPWLLLGYIIDIPALLIPLIAGSLPRKEFGKALSSLPAFFVLRTVNSVFFWRPSGPNGDGAARLWSMRKGIEI